MLVGARHTEKVASFHHVLFTTPPPPGSGAPSAGNSAAAQGLTRPARRYGWAGDWDNQINAHIVGFTQGSCECVGNGTGAGAPASTGSGGWLLLCVALVGAPIALAALYPKLFRRKGKRKLYATL